MGSLGHEHKCWTHREACQGHAGVETASHLRTAGLARPVMNLGTLERVFCTWHY